MDIKKIKNIIEAVLIVSETGLSMEDIKNAIPDSEKKEIEEGLRLLSEEYCTDDRSFTISEIAGRYRIVTKPEYLPWISNLYKKDSEKLTGPSLETLAILAYKQPATRAEIESIRGVNVGGVLKSLLEKGLILVKGRKDVIGRPLVYGTTEKFLEIFGLSSLRDLPGLRDFKEDDLVYSKEQQQILPLEDGEDVAVEEVKPEEDSTEKVEEPAGTGLQSAEEGDDNETEETD